MKRIFIVLFVVLGLGAGAYIFYFRAEATETAVAPAYEFGQVKKRNILNEVSATGTLAARDIVEVGTQVSGTLSQVLVDFNDSVEAGQLVAVIDPSVLDAQVKSAQAELLRAQAQLKQAQNTLERFTPVHQKGYLSDNEFEVYEINVRTAHASVLSAEAGLDRAKQNRGYAEIRTPISGIVIDRTVEPGQTVAASLSAPTLFTIANDLAKMEILANVDESDIGQIKEGQSVRFTVATYLDDTFEGTVEQIRLLPKVVQNVVNYTVVVAAENPRGRLLPGMTATLTFVVEEVQDALSVPASALNLRPDAAMLAVLQARRAQRQARRTASGGGEGGSGGGSGGRRPDMKMLWSMENGALKVMPVRQGVSDGAYAEVVPLRDATITEGMKIITKVMAPAATGATRGRAGGPPNGLRRLGF